MLSGGKILIFWKFKYLLRNISRRESLIYKHTGIEYRTYQLKSEIVLYSEMAIYNHWFCSFQLQINSQYLIIIIGQRWRLIALSLSVDYIC